MVVEKAHQGHVALREAIKATFAIDAANIQGLARAHRQLKQYDEALKRYRDLVNGIDPSEHPALYWSSQLERCQCFAEAFGDDPEAMKKLVTLIRQLKIEDPKLGGLYGRFNVIQGRATRLAEAAP